MQALRCEHCGNYNGGELADDWYSGEKLDLLYRDIATLNQPETRAVNDALKPSQRKLVEPTFHFLVPLGGITSITRSHGHHGRF
jgi:hypothetical protein